MIDKCNNEEFINEINLKRKYLVVIIYDISDNKRRRNVVKCLKGYGIRVQESAFECVLDNIKFTKLSKEIVKYVDVKEDLLRIYKLTKRNEILNFGNSNITGFEDTIIL